MTKRDKLLFERATRRARAIFEATPRDDKDEKELVAAAAAMIGGGSMILDPEKRAELKAKIAADKPAEAQP